MVKLTIFCVLALLCLTNSLPIGEENVNKEINEEPKPVEVSETFIPVTTNGSKDVYVIKTIVYEVGILTEADNSTLNDTESHEEVNLTFFDPKHNATTIDLSNIPVPIQTNISGVEITGLAPANFGTIQLSEDGKPATLTPNFPLPVPLLPNAVISVKHNISTSNVDKETELLGNLPTLLGLTSPITGELLKVENPEKNNVNGEEKEEGKEDEVKESKQEKREIKGDENIEKKGDKNEDKKEIKNESKIETEEIKKSKDDEKEIKKESKIENEENKKSEDDKKETKEDKKDSEEDNDSKEDKSEEDNKDAKKEDKKSKNDDKKDSEEKDNSSSSEESDESKESSEEKNRE